MVFNLLHGSNEYLYVCVNALMHSELGRHYFVKRDDAVHAIEEGLLTESFYVATRDGEFAGFLYFLPNGAFHSYPYLHLFVVNEEMRGQGIGHLMIKAWESLVDRDTLFLCVSDFNPNAKRFYEKNGFIQVGELPDLYRSGTTEYLMMKKR